MRVRWLDQAVHDLESLRSYVAREHPAAAAEIARRIRETVRIRSDFPAGGRIGRVPDTREAVVRGTPYILPYRTKGPTIGFLRVLHAAQKLPDR